MPGLPAFNASTSASGSIRAARLVFIPVIDDGLRPLGVLYANDALETLLNEVEDNEVFLRDYVMGVGYR